MVRSIKLNGTDAGVQLIVDGRVAAIFNRDKAINALDLYNALDYHAYDTYVFENGDCGPIPKGSFDSLEGLILEIVNGINGLAMADSPVDEGSNTSSQDIAVSEEEDASF